MTAVWSENTNVADRTVAKHISSLRQKLLHCADYVQTVAGFGYRLCLPEHPQKRLTKRALPAFVWLPERGELRMMPSDGRQLPGPAPQRGLRMGPSRGGRSRRAWPSTMLGPGTRARLTIPRFYVAAPWPRHAALLPTGGIRPPDSRKSQKEKLSLREIFRTLVTLPGQ
jgi:hypothetical protein